MKYGTTVLLAAVLTVTAYQPLGAQGRGAAPELVQIAEAPNSATAVRNIAAARRAAALTAQTPDGEKPHPPGAQALMALGLALIVTPSMFGGAFSN